MLCGEGLELSYCTNIHPAAGWPDVFASLQQYGPSLKASLSPTKPFGLGLRLSAAEAAELKQPEQIQLFQQFLESNGLYVSLINGFPFGSFHGAPLKDQVFAPDWQTDARRAYTCNLISILSAILPATSDGGVSTVPLSYKAWMGWNDEASWQTIFTNLLACVDLMASINQDTGKFIHLDIEPEPYGLVETTAEFVTFFNRFLAWAPREAEPRIRRHIAVCYDICHMAVEFEDISTSLAAFENAGIRIGRLQVSSALRVDLPAGSQGREEVRAHLAPFADNVYLHQVIGKNENGKFERFPDLPQALECISQANGEWRIHFHVPLFTRDYANFSSTRDTISEVFKVLAARPFTHHLEIETYTWSVLPPDLKQDLGTSIEREYRWVLSQLCAKPQP